MTKDEIHDHVRRILHETFDVDEAAITWDAKLYEDLDIDSIDAVDLSVKLKPLIGKRLDAAAFKSVRTVGDVVEAIHLMMNEEKTLTA